jgi:phage gp37-like protein
MSFIQTAEDAIIKAIQDRIIKFGLLERHVRDYAGEFEEAVLERGIVPNLPIILVSFTGITPIIDTDSDLDDPGTKWNVLSFDIHIAAKSARGDSDARKQKQGIYDLIEHVNIALDGSNLGVQSSQPIALGNCDLRLITEKKTMSLYTYGLTWPFIKCVGENFNLI